MTRATTGSIRPDDRFLSGLTLPASSNLAATLIETTHDGPLEALRVLSEQLANDYGWQPAQATSFILADATPMLPGIRVRTIRRFGKPRPVEVSVVASHESQEPEAVAAAVRRVRAREGLRQRRPDERTAALADFMVGRKADDESRIAWRNACRANGHPDWSYSEPSSFHKAVKRARRAFPDTAVA
jgi:hypothetical protein